MTRGKSDTSKRVRALIDDGAASISELTSKLGRSERTRINSAIQNLVNQKKLVRTGRGGFKTTAEFEGLTAEPDERAPLRSRQRRPARVLKAEPYGLAAKKRHTNKGLRRAKPARPTRRRNGSPSTNTAHFNGHEHEQTIRLLEHQCEILSTKLTAYKEALRFLRAGLDGPNDEEGDGEIE
jgi:hypothetical protein